MTRRWGLQSARAVPAHTAWVAAGRPWGLRRALRWRAGSSLPPLGAALPRYRIGDELHFSQEDAGVGFLRFGWWYPEAHGIWSRTTAARVELPLDEVLDATPRTLALALHPFLSPGRLGLRVSVAVNDILVMRRRFSGREIASREIELSLPEAATTGADRLEITFLAGTMSPADARHSTDLRPLGIGLARLAVR